MKKIGNPNGFTLVEVIIAILLLTVALFSLAGETSVIIGGNSFSKMQTTATTVARDQIELLRNRSFVSISSSTRYPTWVTCSTPNETLKKRWQVTANADNSQKSLAVDINWNGHTVTLNTIVSK